jgi:hypothetical protein
MNPSGKSRRVSAATSLGKAASRRRKKSSSNAMINHHLELELELKLHSEHRRSSSPFRRERVGREEGFSHPI